MEKYKICPTCQTKNPPTMIECIKCETDLSGVPIGEVITESAKEDPVDKTNTTANIKMVRICECGTKNLPSVRKCAGCGEDISDVIPVQDTNESEQEGVHFILSSLDGEYAYELNTNLSIVGRENLMKEYLSKKSFVSRKHAEFLVEVDRLWVKNHSATNHTYANNEIISDNEFFELHDGDIVGLGGKEINGKMQDEAAYFRVRIGTCI